MGSAKASTTRPIMREMIVLDTICARQRRRRVRIGCLRRVDRARPRAQRAQCQRRLLHCARRASLFAERDDHRQPLRQQRRQRHLGRYRRLRAQRWSRWSAIFHGERAISAAESTAALGCCRSVVFLTLTRSTFTLMGINRSAIHLRRPLCPASWPVEFAENSVGSRRDSCRWHRHAMAEHQRQQGGEFPDLRSTVRT